MLHSPEDFPPNRSCECNQDQCSRRQGAQWQERPIVWRFQTMSCPIPWRIIRDVEASDHTTTPNARMRGSMEYGYGRTSMAWLIPAVGAALFVTIQCFSYV